MIRRSRRRGKALVLVGHGSHLSPDSGAPVYEHARRIRAAGHFDEVIEVFWKEEPSLRDALDLVESADVWIVPLFLAEGYFTREVLPRELGLDGAVTVRDQRRVHYCPPIGTHPAMADLIAARAREVRDAGSRVSSDAALVVIGHGTDRSASSADSVYTLVERLRESDEFATVTCGFLDEAPRIADVLSGLDADEVVLVPFFVAEGWHTRSTIPSDLGLTGTLTNHDGRRIWYTPPVGTSDRIPEIVTAVARHAGADAPSTPNDTDDAVPQPDSLAAARTAFLARLPADAEFLPFLQLAIRRRGPGRFDLRHLHDVARELDQLHVSSDPDAAISIARFTGANVYRPLRTAADLRSGWALTDLDERGLWRALDLLYPACLLHWHRHRSGRLEVVSPRDWALRQSGIHADIRYLPNADLPTVVSACCDRRACMRTRLWDTTQSAAKNSADDVVPCREPCTLFATAAREALTTSR